MKLRNTIFALFCAAALAASAIPAKRGAVYQFTQPDGSVVSLEIVGDEHHNYYRTTDGQIVLADGNKYLYATLAQNGDLRLSDMLAHNPAERSADEAMLLSSIDKDKVHKAIFNRPSNMARSNSQDGNGKISSNFPTMGNVKSLVLLVEYSDVPFVTENAHEYFSRLLNEQGFSENGAVGSCYDYYFDASFGQFVPEFDVYGPVTLPKPQSYYGGNTMSANDKNAKEMMLHAAQILDGEVDFSEYDLDNDGYVDNVYIFYAGLSEADGGGADCVWPHQSSVGFNLKYVFDKVQLNRYACGSELSGNKPDGIGTFCHEFGHVLGLPDLYNTEDGNATYTPGNYDLMDEGCYNGDGTMPPTLSAYERNALGWMGDNLVEITGPASCRLEPLHSSNMAYLINTDNPDEYFIFENRQQKGWDSKLQGHGMLIWHIDFDKKLFNSNKPNNVKSHQRVDLIEACNTTSTSLLVRRKYPFPGTGKVTSFTYDTAPRFCTWAGEDLGLPITNIKETPEDGVLIITFDVAGGGDDPAGIEDVLVNADLTAHADGRCISASADGLITVTDITGRMVASADKSLTVDVNAPGIYIVATPSAVVKLLVK